MGKMDEIWLKSDEIREKYAKMALSGQKSEEIEDIQLLSNHILLLEKIIHSKEDRIQNIIDMVRDHAESIVCEIENQVNNYGAKSICDICGNLDFCFGDICPDCELGDDNDES